MPLYTTVAFATADAATARATFGLAGNPTPAAQGLSAWSYDPAAAAAGSLLTNGTVYLVRVSSAPADTVTKVYWAVETVGNTPTSSQNFVGLYDSTGSRLATTNVDSVISSTGLKTTTITGQLLTAGSFYWVGFVFNASTAPTLARSFSGAVPGAAANAGLSAATYRFATAGTSQTSLPSSITPASNTAGTLGIWAALGT